MSFQLLNPNARFIVGLLKRKGYTVDCLTLPIPNRPDHAFDSLPGVLLRATPRASKEPAIAVAARNVSRDLAEFEAASRLLHFVNIAREEIPASFATLFPAGTHLESSWSIPHYTILPPNDSRCSA